MSDLMTLLQHWLPAQRWFHGLDEPTLQCVGNFELPVPEGVEGVRLITVALLRDARTDHGEVYQVPLVVRDVDAQVPALGYIGTARAGDATGAIVDGGQDPAFGRALVEFIVGEGSAGGHGGTAAYGLPMPGVRIGRFETSRALSGEQSNTSIICELRNDDGSPAAPLIVKVYRVLQGGDNPDVTIQTALAAAGSLRVAPILGQVSGRWPDPAAPGGLAEGHLAFAEEFFVGVEDAWRVALRAAEGGEDFTSLARSLGEATAEVHTVLANVLPTVRPAQQDVDEAVARMRTRLAETSARVPSVRARADAIDAVYERAAKVRWPRLQRIHGDYHLGQVLAVPDRGWVLLDFEGEPLRPLAARNAPDAPERDLAGMLRSFDYVAGALSLQAGHEIARDWADAASRAFIEGYRGRVGAAAGPHPLESTTGARHARTDSDAVPPLERELERTADDERALLAAYVLDKAVYEARYEAEHRPTWLPIPLAAITRLLAAR